MNVSRHLKFEELRRLIPALLVSAIAHLMIMQSLPQSVRPHEDTRGTTTPFTVVLARAAPQVVDWTKAADFAGAPRARKESIANSGASGAPKAMAPSGGAVHAVSGATQLVAAGSEPDHWSPALLEPQPAAPASDSVPVQLLEEVQAPDALPLLDYYYTSKEVDEPARATGDGLLSYPREALARRIAGTVTLRLFVDEFGTLTRSEVVNSVPPGIFENAAREAVHTMQFTPALKGGQAVRSQRTVEIIFDPDPAALREANSTRS
jgi:TonB family protein